ncbi:MAG: B12-binding domain-containing protein [Anaerolineales bacterium]
MTLLRTPSAALEMLRSRRLALAERVVELQYARQPQFWRPLGTAGREKSVRDVVYHLTYLAEALEADDPALMGEYLAWVQTLFAGLGFPDTTLTLSLACTRQALEESLAAEDAQRVLEILRLAEQSLPQASVQVETYLQGEGELDQLARQFLEYLLTGQRQPASHLILQSVEAGTPLRDIYLQVFQRSQREVGRLWQINQISVAQEHFCSAATQMIMSQLYPRLFTGARKDRRLVMACVGGELHEIGARMVADFFEMEGWDTYFLGANTPREGVLRAVSERSADLLALSVTMTFHINEVREMIAALRASPASHTRVLVGGYPFNISPLLWQQVGADGYAPDAQAALREADRVLA